MISSALLCLLLGLALASATRPLQGLDMIGVGFDALSGKNKLPVVAWTYSEHNTWTNPFTNQVYDTPDQTAVFVTSEADIGVAVFWSLADYAAAIAQSAGVGGTFLGAFAQSEEVLEAYSVFAGAENILAVTKNTFALYEIASFPAETLTVTKTFSQFVEALPVDYQPQAYQKVINYFGSHVVVQAVFGGEATMYTSLSNSVYATVGAQKVGKIAMAQFNNLTEWGAQGAEAAEVSFVDQGQLLSSLTFVGGVWEEVDQYSSWVKSIKTAPTKISYKLAEISELIPHAQKKINMQKAVAEHLLQVKVNKQ